MTPPQLFDLSDKVAIVTASTVGPVVYLASDASSFETGHDISVSGGMAK